MRRSLKWQNVIDQRWNQFSLACVRSVETDHENLLYLCYKMILFDMSWVSEHAEAEEEPNSFRQHFQTLSELVMSL